MFPLSLSVPGQDQTICNLEHEHQLALQEARNHLRAIEQLRSELGLLRTQLDQAREHATAEAEVAQVRAGLKLECDQDPGSFYSEST